MSGKFAPSKGDWVCSNSRCGNVNFARRDKCNKCGRSKKPNAAKEIGKEFAEKSRGLFSPDDWQCKSCGNVNWARRTICNVCNTAKVNNQGQRTGYGGGYMERDEVVDYKRHDESDDEYDEFGLKKKKFRAAHANGEETATEKAGTSEKGKEESADKPKERGSVYPVHQDEEEDEEEEEESGDDEDLSKYDIWGDADNEEEQKDKKSGAPTTTTENGAIKDRKKEADEEDEGAEIPAKRARRASSVSSGSSHNTSSSSSSDESSSSTSSESSSPTSASSSPRSRSGEAEDTNNNDKDEV